MLKDELTRTGSTLIGTRIAEEAPHPAVEIAEPVVFELCAVTTDVKRDTCPNLRSTDRRGALPTD